MGGGGSGRVGMVGASIRESSLMYNYVRILVFIYIRGRGLRGGHLVAA